MSHLNPGVSQPNVCAKEREENKGASALLNLQQNTKTFC